MAIDVSDVLNWAISETWIDIRRSMALWATQGQRFERQKGIWDEARATVYTIGMLFWRDPKFQGLLGKSEQSRIELNQRYLCNWKALPFVDTYGDCLHPSALLEAVAVHYNRKY